MSLVTVERTKKYLVVKIPLGAVQEGKAGISLRAQKVIHNAIGEGLHDVEAGRTFGPFESVREFKSALRRVSFRR